MAEDQTPTLQQQLQGLIKATAEGLELKTKEQLNSIVLSVETINQQLATMAAKKDVEIVGQLKKDLDEVNKNLKANQEVIDNFVASQEKRTTEKKDFGTTWQEQIKTQLEGKQDILKSFQTDRDARLSFELKVGNMLIANVTGDTVQAYNTRQGMVPNQKVNIRDILTTTPSPSGSFVTYRETGTSGAIGVQTEGQSKSQIDYSWTEEKKVSVYIAGFAVFSKQLMYALPFLNTQLPRQLLRDFYKKENDYFYSALQSAAAGNNSTTGAANTPEQILQLIANQRNADFNSSYLLTDWLTWARVLATKGSVEYGIPGGVVFDNTGNVRVVGVPMIGASFADPESMLIWDNEQVERVETESLRVEFSFEDNDNFRKNLVTAKVECFEELNVLRPDAIIDTTTS